MPRNQLILSGYYSLSQNNIPPLTVCLKIIFRDLNKYNLIWYEYRYPEEILILQSEKIGLSSIQLRNIFCDKL